MDGPTVPEIDSADGNEVRPISVKPTGTDYMPHARTDAALLSTSVKELLNLV